MKPSITRWKIVPGYIASDDVMPSLVHSRPPVARSTKFLTVLGACSGISVTVNEPLLVTNVAVVIGVLSGLGRSASSEPKPTRGRRNASASGADPRSPDGGA